MKFKPSSHYYVYILTNQNKTVLYIGVTNNLTRRLLEHLHSANPGSFTHKYQAHYLIYFETYKSPGSAIKRETQVKKWSRQKKEDLINITNPNWYFLNDNIL